MTNCKHCTQPILRYDNKQHTYCSNRCRQHYVSAQARNRKPSRFRQSKPCQQCRCIVVRRSGEHSKDWRRRKHCSLTCAGAARSVKPRVVPLPRVYVGTDLRSGLTRSETAAEMTRRYPKEDGPYTVDQIEAIELRALAKLRAVAEECKFIREWFDLRSAS